AAALPDLARHRLLAPNLPRILVLAEPLVRGRPQVAVVRPLDEIDLADELRLDPDDVSLPHSRHLRDLGKRRRLPLARAQLAEEPIDLPVGEAGAAVADIGEPAAAEDGEKERP